MSDDNIEHSFEFQGNGTPGECCEQLRAVVRAASLPRMAQGHIDSVIERLVHVNAHLLDQPVVMSASLLMAADGEVTFTFNLDPV